MKKIILHLFLAIILLACNNSDNDSNSGIVNNIDSLMNYSHINGLFNGTVLVSQNNEVIYRNSFGYADFDKNEFLIPESSFYLASVSKQFTTMAVMLLKERGKLSYEDRLSDYFSDFPEYADIVTIRHMMTHTSGIPDHYGLNAYKVGLNNDDVYELLMKQEDLDFEPGNQFSYSNGGYVLLSMIVEKASGEPFHEFMKTNIFIPLEMTNTLVYDKSEPMIANRAIGYNISGKLDDYEIFTTGAGGIYSNVDDLFKWDQALNSDQLISSESLNEAYQPYVLSSGDTSYYGFGWGINQEKNWVGHSGGLSGFRTYLRRYPDKGNTFMLLTNKGDGVAMGNINTSLEMILANEDFELPKVPLSNKLGLIIESDGIDKAIETVMDLLSQNTNEFEFDESGINTLGYSFLQSEDNETALKLFKLNVEVRPNSGNSYDSYAEALLANMDTLAAIKNYTISVRMNPNNQNGINVLESLGIDTNEILPNIKLSVEQLDNFVGSYELDPDFILNIIREGNQLYIHPTGQSKTELFPSTESKYYSKAVDAQITFNRDVSGKVVSLTLHQGGDNEAKRIE
jgi:CubicO group peptidase (beta-lactamase class C family)